MKIKETICENSVGTTELRYSTKSLSSYDTHQSTKRRIATRIKQHVPTSIRTKNTIIREQPPDMCKNSTSKMKSDSAIGQHLIKNPECAKTFSDQYEMSQLHRP